jgi:hypothetical protein
MSVSKWRQRPPLAISVIVAIGASPPMHYVSCTDFNRNALLMVLNPTIQLP